MALLDSKSDGGGGKALTSAPASASAVAAASNQQKEPVEREKAAERASSERGKQQGARFRTRSFRCCLAGWLGKQTDFCNQQQAFTMPAAVAFSLAAERGRTTQPHGRTDGQTFFSFCSSLCAGRSVGRSVVYSDRLELLFALAFARWPARTRLNDANSARQLTTASFSLRSPAPTLALRLTTTTTTTYTSFFYAHISLALPRFEV